MPTEAMRQSRQRASDHKKQRVQNEVAAAVRRGEHLAVSEVAARADVSRKFIYDHPELLESLRQAMAGIADQLAGRGSKDGEVTAASLRVDLANSQDQVRRLQQQVRTLEGRLSKYMGIEFEEGLPAADRMAIAADRDLQRQLQQIEVENLQLKRQLDQRTEELEGARTVNRELMATLNQRARE